MKNMFFTRLLGLRDSVQEELFSPRKENNVLVRSENRSLYTAIVRYLVSSKCYLNPDLSLSDLSKKVGSNRLYVSRAINECSGLNFKRFLNWYRIMFAVELINSDGRLKISEVSKASGFNSQPTFNFAFRLVMGMAPSEYARQISRRRLRRPGPSRTQGQVR